MFTCTVEDRPQRTPDPEGGPSDDRKRNMINGTDPTRHADEDSGDEISNPHAQPSVPPSQPAARDHGGGNHPSIDIEGISNPEPLERRKVSLNLPVQSEETESKQMTAYQQNSKGPTGVFQARRASSHGL